MGARKQSRPATKPALVAPRVVSDPQSARAFDEHSTAIAALERVSSQSSARLVVDLVIGLNRVAHNLGRIPRHCSVTPTVCSAAFAYALVAATESTATIDVAGTDQAGAGVELA